MVHRNQKFIIGTNYFGKFQIDFYNFLFLLILDFSIFKVGNMLKLIKFFQFSNIYYLGGMMIINSITIRSENPFQKSIIFGISFCIILVFTTGFYIPVYKMPYFIEILCFPNFTRTFFESWIIILYKNRCSVTSSVFNSYGITESQLNTNLLILIIEGISLQIIALILHLYKLN